MKKSIRTKIFQTVLTLSLLFGFLIGTVAISQFILQKVKIEKMNKSYEQELTEKAKTQMNVLNKEIAENLSALHGSIVNENFVSVRTLAQSTANYMESLYVNAQGEASLTEVGASESGIGLMPGTDRNLVQDELNKIASVRQYIATREEYNRNSQDVLDIYIVTESGICMDATETVYEGTYPELRTTDWYLNAKESQKPYWADTFTGAVTGIQKITCGVPFYDDNGIFLGVVAVDLAINHIYDTALSIRSEQVEHALLLDNAHNIMINPDGYDISGLDFSESIVVKDGGFVSFVGIPETDWTLCLVFQFDLVQEATTNIAATIADNNAEMDKMMNQTIKVSILLFLLLTLVSCIIIFFLSRKVSGSLSAPINRLTKEVGIIGTGNLDYKIQNMDTGDEISLLADSFNEMTVRLKKYVENLATMTAEKERIGAELDVARHIQSAMLPCLFPPFPERSELDIYATMTPAKEVGGDFYDFFLADDDHLVMVMADVSGKGVPAALFMVIAKTLLKNCGQTTISPKEILEKVNNQLCENNDAELFVTVWLGILELSTGKLVAANAGHEYPVIKRDGKEYELFKDPHGFVLAGMEGSHYKEYELVLNSADRLYLYTDGVAEATNTQNELYGTDRMLAALNLHKDANTEELLRYMKEDIDQFVGEAPQFDDITMLALEFQIKGDAMKKIQLKPSLDYLDTATEFVEQELDAAQVSMAIIAQINIVVDEIFSNIANYSRASDVTVGCQIKEDIITLRFADNGIFYDPTIKAEPDISLTAEERSIGGLGIYMVKKFMDSVDYEYRDKLNILVLTKKLS